MLLIYLYLLSLLSNYSFLKLKQIPAQSRGFNSLRSPLAFPCSLSFLAPNLDKRPWNSDALFIIF